MASILLIHPFDALAGSQRVAARIAEVLSTAGHALEVRLGFGSSGFVSRRPAVRRFLDIDSIKVRKLLYPLWLLAMAPRTAHAALRGDVLWANTIHAVPAVLLALLLAPRRVVIHLHEIEFPRPFRPFLRFAAARGASLLCVSELQREALGLDAQVLPNFAAFSEEEPAPGAGTRLVFVGTTSAAKGFSLFVDVVRNLSGCGVSPVAFMPDRQGCDAALLARAEGQGISLRFGVTDPSELYAGGLLTLLCTDPALVTETFSLVAIESMSRLVPVGSAGTRVVKEVMGSALAFDVPDRDPARIAGEIRALLAGPARHRELVEACRTRRALYSPELFRRRVLEIVKRLSPGASA